MSKHQEFAATGDCSSLLKTAVICALLALGTAATQAYSQVSVSIGIGIPVAPPLPRVEVVPVAPAPGYVWAPGYWAWHEGRHIWIRGRWIVGRPGQHYVAEHWEQRGPNHFLVAGRWEHDARGRGVGREEHGRGRDRDERGRGRSATSASTAAGEDGFFLAARDHGPGGPPAGRVINVRRKSSRPRSALDRRTAVSLVIAIRL